MTKKEKLELLKSVSLAQKAQKNDNGVLIDPEIRLFTKSAFGDRRLTLKTSYFRENPVSTIKQHPHLISRCNRAKGAYQLILDTPMEEFKQLLSELKNPVKENKDEAKTDNRK